MTDPQYLEVDGAPFDLLVRGSDGRVTISIRRGAAIPVVVVIPASRADELATAIRTAAKHSRGG